MTSCPECASSNLKNLGTEEAETGDQDYAASTTKYECQDCGCRFEVTERTELTTEVSVHGRDHVPEEWEED
jgi:transcriptional regulator NrdR family protein